MYTYSSEVYKYSWHLAMYLIKHDLKMLSTNKTMSKVFDFNTVIDMQMWIYILQQCTLFSKSNLIWNIYHFSSLFKDFDILLVFLSSKIQNCSTKKQQVNIRYFRLDSLKNKKYHSLATNIDKYENHSESLIDLK